MPRRLREIAGFALIAFGLAGTLLPIIPGIPLIIAGVALVGSDHPILRPLLEKVRRWRNHYRINRSSPATANPDFSERK